MYKNMNFEIKNMPYSSFEKLGMSKKDVLNLPSDDLGALLSGRTTGMLPIRVNVDGIDLNQQAKLSLYALPDNSLSIKVHPYRHEIQNDHNLDKEQLDRLKNGETVVAPKTSLNGEKENYIFQLDKQINEIRFLRVNDINIPKSLLGNEITPKQREDLLEGKTVELKTQDGVKAVSVDLIGPKGFSVKEQEHKMEQKSGSDRLEIYPTEKQNRDKNQNGIPDRFDNDVNRNGIPDTKEAFTRQKESLDQGHTMKR